MSRRTFPSEAKPFVFVSIPREAPIKKEYVPLDSYVEELYTGKLQLDLQVISDYLFVGSGSYDFRREDKIVYYSFFRSGGEIKIPGTSIKGAVRSVLEAISNSCVSQLAGKKKTGKNRFKADEKKDRYIHKKHTHRKCKDELKLCPACLIFGTTGYSGRISFSDGVLKSSLDLDLVKIGELFGPTIVKLQRKFYQNKRFNPVDNLRPEKNYRFVEAVKKGSVFETTLSFHNISLEEFSLILHSMGLNQKYMIKIGGAKPRCFGTIRFIPKKLRLLRGMMDMDEITGGDLNKFIVDVLNRDNLISKDLLNEYNLDFSKLDEFCPKGVY